MEPPPPPQPPATPITPVTEELRCTRTDGKKWRCKRRVMENTKLCEIHYMQGRHRQYREKVPDDLKIQRHTLTAPCEHGGAAENITARIEKVEDMVLLLKRKKLEEPHLPLPSISPTVKIKKKKNKEKTKKSEEKKCELNLELIRLVLRREVEKRNTTPTKKKKKKKSDDVASEEVESTRDLPNGRMSISSCSSQSFGGNAGSNSAADVRIGPELGAFPQRLFRSENIEPMPVGAVKVLPCGDENEARLRMSRRKRCHRCEASGSSSGSAAELVKCCKKHLFCLSCIEKRYFDTQEGVKMSCPVCRGTCTCKECSEINLKVLKGKSSLKYISNRLILAAVCRRKKLSEIYIKQADFSCSMQKCCNKCKASIVDLHRSCPNCSYNLCLSCCRDQFYGTYQGDFNTFISRCCKGNDAWASCNGKVLKMPSTTQKKNVQNISSFASLTNLEACNVIGGISCPPKEFGGCGNSFLDLRCFFPVNWIKDLEVTAEEIVCSYEFPETSDASLSCPLCLDTDKYVNGVQQLQIAALRENSNDNYLFYPKLIDIHGGNVEHFQKHWSKGHPVIVRDVLRTTSELSWDPVYMFCTYLQRSIDRYENNKNSLEAIHCLDWCEVEMGIKQYFMGSLNGQTQRNSWNETLKLKGWLSSQLFQEQFPAHYAEIMHTLPLQEYMNPSSGLLNVAARMPQEIPKPDLGPCVYISYGCSEQYVQADSVIKLCTDSYDVVNILAHTSNAPISDEQISKIRKLLKRHNQNQRGSSTNTSEQTRERKENGNSALHSKHKEQVRSHNVIGEEMHLRKRISRIVSAAANEKCTRNLSERNMPFDGESDVDSEATLSCSRSINNDDSSDDEESPDVLECSNGFAKPSMKSCTAQWDVFRREDVPKLIEYLRRHSNEFHRKYDVHKHVDHPIFYQSFFLDAYHKRRLKEELNIEPWTFEQHIGEAVIIPAGCPYQISSPKACVHVVLDFMSPENVTQCIQLMDEVRLLPEPHKAKLDKLEVKKMALFSISSAIKEIRELTSAM